MLPSGAGFEDAFTKVKKKYPHISHSLALLVLEKFEVRRASDSNAGYAKRSFGELIRLTLNECRVGGGERKMYSSIIGHYFTPRANAAKKRLRSKGTEESEPTSPPPPQPPINVIEDKNGQLRWEI